MTMETIHNPAVPGTYPLDGMFVGKIIYVYGIAEDDPNRFAINLKCGPESDDDIALHFNPRFDEQQVVRNTRTGGSWGHEERDGGFPFKKGKIFGIWITCGQNHFEMVANNGRKFKQQYNHRLPLSSITHVHIAADFHAKVIAAGIVGANIPVQIISKPVTGPQLEIPFHNIRDRSVTVIGKPTESSGRFSINFLSKDGSRNHFHFNPRLKEQQIVRNTKQEDGWGQEERDLDIPFPFQSGVPFQLKICASLRRYAVQLNGMELLEYRKRLKHMKDIRGVAVYGDVEIAKVLFA